MSNRVNAKPINTMVRLISCLDMITFRAHTGITMSVWVPQGPLWRISMGGVVGWMELERSRDNYTVDKFMTLIRVYQYVCERK